MQLNVKSYGQGEPLIILHGLFGMLDNWQTIAKKLAENYSVFALDLRNHGRSPHSDVFDYTVMANDVVEFMESNSIYSAAVLGHSMGGKVAMRLALDHPDLVEKLLVVDIAPKAYAPGHNLIFEALCAMDLSNAKSRSEVQADMMSRLNNPSVVSFLLKNLARNPNGGYKWKMNLKVIRANYHNVNSTIDAEDSYSGPTLFLRGAKSPYIKDSDWEEILTVFPEASLFTVENAGHWVHADAPEVLLDAVTAFLR